MRLFAAFVLAPLSLAGQIGGIVAIQPSAPAAAPATQYAAEDLCTVEGQLLNAATGEPVRRGVLSLLNVENTGSPGSMANSDSEGRFAFRNVELGKYSFMSQHTGFMTAWYGANGSRRSSATLTLERSQKLTGIVLKMTPMGAVAGRILDENGDPVSYAQVRLARFQYVQGRKRLVSDGGSAFTNDLGQYRVFDVPPGKYYLGVDYWPRAGSVDLPRAPQDDEEYVTTYYPSAIDPASAALIEVGAGSQVQNVNLRLLRIRTVRVRGKVTGLPPSDRAPAISLSLIPRSSPQNLGMSGRGASVGPQGAFEIAGVSPGAYTLLATVYTLGATRMAPYSTRQRLDVGTVNVSDVMVIIPPPVEVNGKICVEGSAPASLKGLMVTLASTDPYTGSSGKAVNDDLTFKLENLSPDRYYVSVSPLPAGYYLKAVRAGGVDMIDTGLDLTSGAAPPLEIVLSPNAGQVAGVVQSDTQEHSVVGATVALIPQEKERRDRESYYRTALSDGNGRFAFRNLPPGEYQIFAWEEMEDGAYLDPEFVRPQESKGEPVTVQKGDKLNVRVKLIPAESPRASR